MIQSRRLAYAVLSTTDVDKQARYFENVLGLHRAFSDTSRAVLSTQHGLECIVLERDGAQPGLKGLAFEIAPKISLEEAKPKLPRSIRIRVPLETATDGTVEALHTLFAQNKGEAKVLFDVERQGDFMVVMEAEGYNVQPDRNFIARVEDLCGRGAVRIID